MKHRIFGTALACVLALPAVAGDAWDSVKTELYGDRILRDGSQMIAIDAPYRTTNDSRTQIAAQIVAKGASHRQRDGDSG